jgi:hypothetical protein
MSLLLNGAKTMTIAGTEMQCLEIYTGEAYTFPINFTDSGGNPANALYPNAWTLGNSATYYTVDNVVYSATSDVVTLGNININDPQPNAANYTLVADWVTGNAANGQAYLYLGSDMTGNGLYGNNGVTTPVIGLANNAANSTLIIVTLTVTRESELNASLDNVNREPLGFIVRYQ